MKIRLFFWIFLTISTRFSNTLWLLSDGYMNNFKHFTCVQLQFFQGLKIITQHCSLYGNNSILPFIWNSYSFRVITFCVRRFITFCVKKLLHFALTLLLHFALILFHFALILHFEANVITFCVSITFCGDYYILQRYTPDWERTSSQSH